jgi:hypothetical protein
VLRHPDDEVAPPLPSADPSTPSTPPGPAAHAATNQEPIAEPDASLDTSRDDAAPTDEPPTTSTAWSQHTQWPTPPSPPHWARPAWPQPPRPPRRRSFLTPLTISLLLIGAGVAAVLDGAGAVHLTVAGVLASALIVVGGALVVSTWFGRAHGLIPIGLLLLLVTIPAATIDVPISGGIGERHFHPTTRATLQRNYELGIGRVVVDLRDAPLSGRVTSISSSVGIGELDVDVPADVRVDVRAHAGAGATEIFGRLEDGWPQDTRRITGNNQTGVLHLDLRVGAGSIHVRRWSSDGALELS